MRGATILSKDPGFFDKCVHALSQLNYNVDIASNSIRLIDCNGAYFLFYDNITGIPWEEDDIPPETLSQGYRHGFLVDCRSEELFCKVIRALPLSLDMLICDADDNLYRQNEVLPESIEL